MTMSQRLASSCNVPTSTNPSASARSIVAVERPAEAQCTHRTDTLAAAQAPTALPILPGWTSPTATPLMLTCARSQCSPSEVGDVVDVDPPRAIESLN